MAEMTRHGYSEQALWRLVRRHIPGFAWQYGVTNRRLKQAVLEHLYPRPLPHGNPLRHAAGVGGCHL